MDTTTRTLERQVANDPATVVAFGGSPYQFGEARGWSREAVHAADGLAQEELATLQLARGEMAGPCLGAGAVLRETAKFYVVQDDRGRGGQDQKPRKIAKVLARVDEELAAVARLREQEAA